MGRKAFPEPLFYRGSRNPSEEAKIALFVQSSRLQLLGNLNGLLKRPRNEKRAFFLIGIGFHLFAPLRIPISLAGDRLDQRQLKWIGLKLMVALPQAAVAQNASHQLADFLLSESRERGELLTPLKLQKLMFYADAWYMALYDQEITTERFQAWVHGPVSLSQYHRFKRFQWRPIDENITRPDFEGHLRNHLVEIVDVFGSETAVALEMMTHQEVPWREARNGLPDDEPCNAFISKQTTKEFYRALGQD